MSETKSTAEPRRVRWFLIKRVCNVLGMEISTAILTSEDWLECSCGNAPHTSGFYPCSNINGEWVECEPTPEVWVRENYFCAQCEAVYDITDKPREFYKDIRFYYLEKV